MTWKEFIASAIESLAWPTITLILAFVLRSSIIDLILRIKRIKHKDTELEFEAKIKEIAAEVSERPQSEKIANSPLSELATVSPRAAITESWIGLESLLYKKAIDLDKLGLKKHQVQFPAIMTILTDLGVLDQKSGRAIMEMRQLRNQVAHTDVHVDSEVAKRYIQLVNEFSEKLK